MKIAMVSGPESPLNPADTARGGSQGRYIGDLAAALADQGHQVTVYARRDSRKLADRVRVGARLQVVHLTAGPTKPLGTDKLVPQMGRLGERLAELWRKSPPDVVHAHSWTSGLAALGALTASEGPESRIPLVLSYHLLGVTRAAHQRGRPSGQLAEQIELERLIGRQVAKVAAASSEDVFELVRMGVPRANIAVVPAGVDPDRFNPDGPAAATDRSLRLVSAGGLEPHQGHDAVIAALPRITEAELLIAGGPAPSRLSSDPGVRRLRKLADALGVANRIRLLGRLPEEEMPALLRSASVVVCAPWYEPFGMVSLQAMACAVPVVATAVGALGDLVVNGVTGLHVPPRRPDALASAIRSLVADPTSREAFGLAGYDRVRARYSWQRVATDLLRVYEAAGAAGSGTAVPAAGVAT